MAHTINSRGSFKKLMFLTLSCQLVDILPHLWIFCPHSHESLFWSKKSTYLRTRLGVYIFLHVGSCFGETYNNWPLYVCISFLSVWSHWQLVVPCKCRGGRFSFCCMSVHSIHCLYPCWRWSSEGIWYLRWQNDQLVFFSISIDDNLI